MQLFSITQICIAKYMDTKFSNEQDQLTLTTACNLAIAAAVEP